jgi:Domain of unknown function (DUF6468)
MVAMEWTLEIVLVVLLGATLFQAIRLERALVVLKRDRSSLESLVVGFNASTHQAENGIQQLRSAADGAGRDIDAQLTKSMSLKDDLAYLTERGDRLADRLDNLVRASRPLTRDHAEDKLQVAATGPAVAAVPTPGATNQVERELLAALRMAR